MRAFRLRSYEFRREREPSWQDLEEVLARIERVGLHRLDAEELYRLPVLYRAAASSLSVARAISLDRNLVAYLEGLVARAYLRVYGARQGAASSLVQFFGRRFPALVRELRWGVALSLALMVLGIAAGYALTLDDLSRYHSLVPPEIAQGRMPTSPPEELLAVLKESGETRTDRLAAFASFLFTHNSRVGMLCFALGPAAGAPVVLLLFGNGLILGAMAAVYRVHELGVEFWAWILPHGVTELLALALCGAAGFALGRAVVLPGRHGRLHELAREGRRAAAIVAGAVAMLLVAALLEGFFRQLVLGEVPRYAVAGASAAFWAWYFLRAGRDPEGGPAGATGEGAEW